MKLEIHTLTRVGIAADVLSVFSQHGFVLRGVEIKWHFIYVDVPRLRDDHCDALFATLLEVDGVHAVQKIDMLPGEVRRYQLDTLVAAMQEPLFVVDADSCVIMINEAGNNLVSQGDFIDHSIGKPEPHLSDSATGRQLQKLISHGGSVEIPVGRKSYYVVVIPIAHDQSSGERGTKERLGAMLLFRSLAQIGHDLSRVSNQPTEDAFSQILGTAPVLVRARDLIARFAPINATILIQGETGTGKELAARACHDLSPRKNKSFLALNCAAIPENLAESELFGHEPGAFSGAGANGKPGLVELADGGTLFLDEIGELSPYIQAKLLRFLEDGSFLRVGGKAARRVDVRLIAATHRNLEKRVAEGRFRQDLYYRLNVLSLELPALRDRREDIPMLAETFTQRASRQIGRTPVDVPRTVMRHLQIADWPGNVRQLQNAIFRAVSMLKDSENHLSISAFPDNRASAKSDESLSEAPAEKVLESQILKAPDFKSAQALFERFLLRAHFKDHPSSRKLAKRLDISHTVAARKLKRAALKP